MATVYILLVMLSSAPAQEQSAAAEPAVVAMVDGEPIHLSEVERLVEKAARPEEITPAALPVLQAQALSELIDRRLVLAYAKRTDSGATAAEVDAALAKQESSLKAQGRSLEEYLKEQSLTAAELGRQITWNLTWEKYLARYATDARLESYFNAHRREFDGTQLVVSHVLLRPAAGDDAKAMADLLQQAGRIREEIISGKLSFGEAAGRYSTGPSAKDGGRLGPIGREGPMVEAFSRAAFALEAGQLSQPVSTPFGVHLIRCDEIVPGSKVWTEVREQLTEALARELLGRLARVQQGYSRVEFTGKVPHFKPGTRELAVP
jgi:peptidyl-prolyl cis-trans isomerase C